MGISPALDAPLAALSLPPPISRSPLQKPSLVPAKTLPQFTPIVRRLRQSADKPHPRRFDSRSCSARMAAEAASIAVAGGKGESDLRVFDSEDDLSTSLAKYTAELSEKYARERGSFSVVLSGGSLIKALRKLVAPPYVDSVEWDKWRVFWVDERVVPKDHADSNYKLAYDGFLSKVPIPPGQVYAINDSLSAEGAADDYETCLRQLVKERVVDLSETSGFPKFDLMLLGMGPDGHLASLFPGHPLVNENQKWVTFIKDSPKPPPERITFTFPIINSAANIAMVVTGTAKASTVHRALGSEEGSFDLLPVQMVSQKMTWFADKEAVSKLYSCRTKHISCHIDSNFADHESFTICLDIIPVATWRQGFCDPVEGH